MHPADFDKFWNGVETELSAMPAAPEEEWIPLRSGPRHRCYGVRLTSIGPYRIFAYLTIPEGAGPFPAVHLFPRYMSVVEPLWQGLPRGLREQCVVFSLAARGHRNADQPDRALFPGMLTDGVEAPERYVFRGVVADCLRGLECLLSRPDVNASRIALVGTTEIPLLVAALKPTACCVSAHPALFYRTAELAPRFPEYPQEEINDYCRAYPQRAKQLHQTLSYFDPMQFASRITAPTLLWAASENAPWPAEELAPLAERFHAPVECRDGTGSTYEDGIYREPWLAGHLGTSVVLPRIWTR